MYHVLTKCGKVELVETRSTCADLLFALFICPAICDPEPHGITTDVPIRYKVRSDFRHVINIYCRYL